LHSKYDEDTYQCQQDWPGYDHSNDYMCIYCGGRVKKDNTIDLECSNDVLNGTTEDEIQFWLKDTKNVTAVEFCFNGSHTELVMSSCFCPPGESFRKYLIVLIFVGYVIPLVLISICYFGIVYISSKYTIRSKGSTLNAPVSGIIRNPRDQRVLRMVFILVLAFVLCWTPFQLKNASHVFDIHLNSEHCTYLSNIAAIGVVTNSVLNPVIYSFLSTNFRQKVSRRTRNFIRMLSNTSRLDRTLPGLPNPFSRDVSTTQNTISTEIVKNQNSLNDQPLILNQAHPLLQK